MSTPVNQPWPGLINAYRDRLPVEAGWTPITLLEGGTPLIDAKQLSEMMGGSIAVTSTPGAGSQFEVILPFAVAQDGAAIAAATAAAAVVGLVEDRGR